MVDELPISRWISLLLYAFTVQQLAADPGKITGAGGEIGAPRIKPEDC